MKKIAIHSVPRSGSSWLGEIVNSSPNVNYSYQPLFSYEFKSFLDESSTREDIELFFENLKTTKDKFIRQIHEREIGSKPKFNKNSKLNELDVVAYKEVRYHNVLSNLLDESEDIKVIGLVRDPVSVINSWANAPREFRADLGWVLEDELYSASKKNEEKKEEFYGLKKWVEVVKLFESLQIKYPERFLLLRYEQLMANKEKTVEELFDFLELSLTEQTKSFIGDTKKVKGTYSVMKSSPINISLDEDVICKVMEYVKESGLGSYLMDRGV